MYRLNMTRMPIFENRKKQGHCSKGVKTKSMILSLSEGLDTPRVRSRIKTGPEASVRGEEELSRS